MKLLLLFSCLVSFATAEDFPLSQERIAEIKKSLGEWQEVAVDQGALNQEDYLDKLGLGLRKTSERGPYTVGDRAKTHQALREKILSIPGHADHFGNRINFLYGGIKQAYAEGKTTGDIFWSHYMTESMNAFITLSMLPSHETVRVLGTMLSDDWKWPDYEKDKLFGTLDVYSLSFLSKLPFADPPTKPLETSEDAQKHLQDWKLWYAEVKSGRRTFRFIGDDTEYDLRGPVRRGDSVERNRGAKRPLSEGVPESQAAGSENKPFRLLPYAMAFLFVAAGIWSLIRKNRRKPSAVSR